MSSIVSLVNSLEWESDYTDFWMKGADLSEMLNPKQWWQLEAEEQALLAAWTTTEQPSEAQARLLIRVWIEEILIYHIPEHILYRQLLHTAWIQVERTEALDQLDQLIESGLWQEQQLDRYILRQILVRRTITRVSGMFDSYPSTELLRFIAEPAQQVGLMSYWVTPPSARMPAVLSFDQKSLIMAWRN